MLDQYVNQGRTDALQQFGLAKHAMSTADLKGMRLSRGGGGGSRFSAPPSAPTAAASSVSAEAPVAVGGFLDKAKAFGMGQVGHAKDLFGHLRQGLGGAATPEAGALARQNALGSLKGLAPSLLAGGALYMMHRHNQAKNEAEARQRMMMGGIPGM
jgi:hypothetical protein